MFGRLIGRVAPPCCICSGVLFVPWILAIPGGQRDGDYLADLIARRRLTTAHFVPSMLEAFLRGPDLERCRSLRRVVCSGEALPAEYD